jgi:hypothetical protein
MMFLVTTRYVDVLEIISKSKYYYLNRRKVTSDGKVPIYSRMAGRRNFGAPLWCRTFAVDFINQDK